MKLFGVHKILERVWVVVNVVVVEVEVVVIQYKKNLGFLEKLHFYFQFLKL